MISVVLITIIQNFSITIFPIVQSLGYGKPLLTVLMVAGACCLWKKKNK